MIKMICLILGGGVGSRLYPLTKDRSKPAVPIGGKYRLIDIPISNCINSGVKRMFVLTQYNSASLNQHIKNTYHFDNFNPGFVDILAAEQTPTSPNWFQGTADAVRQSMHHLANHDHDYVLILSGDHLYQMDFEKFAVSHIDKNADLSIATIPCTGKEASEFGIMKVDAAGYISSFVEKPKKDVLSNWKSEMPEADRKAGRDYLASMGIYIFNRKALLELFANNPDATDFGKEIIPKALEGGYRVSSYQFNGYWTDIGTISSFYESNIALTADIPQFNLFDNQKIVYTRARMLPPSKIFGTRLDHSVVTEGSIIHAESVERSIIGIRSRVGKGTKIRWSIIMGNDYYQTIPEMVYDKHKIPMGIGQDCIIDHAIIDKNCRIGNNVIIKGGDHLPDSEGDTYVIRDGIVVLKKGAIVPEGTVIGE